MSKLVQTRGERGYKAVGLLLSQHASTQFRTGLHNYSRTRSYDSPPCIQLFQHIIVASTGSALPASVVAAILSRQTQVNWSIKIIRNLKKTNSHS